MPDEKTESHLDRAMEHIGKAERLAEQTKDEAQEAKNEVRQVVQNPVKTGTGEAGTTVRQPDPTPMTIGSTESSFEQADEMDPPENTAGGSALPGDPSSTRPDY